MAGSKELNKVIKSFLNFCNISAENSTYLETGLLYGESVLFALELNFKKIISIDINKTFIDKAHQRFKDEINNSKVLLVQGDSQEKIKENYNQFINIFFLDAHDNEIDESTIAPLENEIKFLLSKINEKQLIIIDDFIKIKHSFLFTNRKKSWKSKLSYKRLKEIISLNSLNAFEIYSNSGINCYLLLTKNKEFRIGKIFYLRNLIYKFFIHIRFYYKKKLFSIMLIKFVTFLIPHRFYISLKEYFNKFKK